MKRKAILFGLGASLFILPLNKAIFANSPDAKQEEGLKDKAQKIDCLVCEDSKSHITRIKVDDKEFCSSSNFSFYGKKSEKDIQASDAMTSDDYSGLVVNLLRDNEEFSKENPLHKELVGVLISFYRSPYRQLTVFIKDGDIEYSRTINK